ncbi:hypothetical protein [Amycolatopsis sp. NPDC051903]|uniref:hypothetical protein n=1 Tax=Amycolatopsis sp. NPDC051903 TaxID=3363936 RepID=UPI00379B0E2B
MARLVLERFDPKKAIERQFGGEGLKGGQLEGAVTHVRYDVRRFEVAAGVWVREFTVPLEVTSSTRSVSGDARTRLVQELQEHLDNTVNQHYTLPGGDQLHVRIDARVTNEPADDSWTADPSRGVPVNVHDATKDKGTPRTNQTNWDVNDNPTGLTHEIMHFVGLGEGYRNPALLFNRTDQPGVMGRDAWTDSSLTDDNLAKIEDLSNQAVIHDHHLGDPAAKPNRPYRPPPSTQDLTPRPNLHTPTEAPSQHVQINGKDVTVEPGSTVARDVFEPAQHELLGTHGLEGVYVGPRGDGNFHLAVRASISADAPREHARITADLDNARTQTDPDALATAANVRVHVLNPDGSWTSHGPETGRPVHVVMSTVNGHDTYFGTKENVHIGRAKVSYPGPTALLDKKDVKPGQQFDKDKRKVLHRGEFEVETIRGEQYVRMYTAVLNPAAPNSDHKDVHQDPDGKVTPFSGGKGGIFWVGGGRPMRAVQWTSKYETDPNLKPGMQPVLRSFLVPIDTFTKVSKEATVEALSQDNTLAVNVDQTGDVNQFGLRGEHFEQMQQNALKGSLVTYAANPNYDLPHLAGRREDLADLHTRLGLPPNFRSDELGKDNDPWFEWTKDKGEDRKYFRNDPESLRALAKKLSDLYHTHLELKGGPNQDAYFAPTADSIPADKGGKSKHAEPSTREQREQDLNVFLNTRGPAGSVIKQLTDGIAGTLGADLDRGPDTVALDGNTVRAAVVTATKNIGGTLKDVVNKEFRALHTNPVTNYVSADAKIETIEKMREVMADTALVDAIAKNTAEQVVRSTLDSIGANRGVEGPGGFRERLTTAVEKAVKDQFTVTDGKFSPAIEDGFEKNQGAKKNYFAGNRADAVAAEVSNALKNAELDKHVQESGLGFDRDTVKRRLSEGVLPEAVSDVTTKNLVGLDQKQLQHEFENGLANAAAKVRASLDTDPVLKFTTEAQRTSLADQAGQVLNPDTVKGITFTPVTQREVDDFMAKVPDHATQAEIGAAIATDEKRVKVDFNTRENTYDPAGKAVDSKTFDNDYSEFSEKGHLQWHPKDQFGRHQAIGAGLDTVIGDELAKPDDHRGAERILDHLLKELDAKNPDYHDSLRRKFDEVVAVAGKHNRYRVDARATKPNTFGEHAQMVLNQYLRLTRGEQDAGRFVSRDTLAKAILFHDMEKQNSKNQFGGGQEQHDNEPEHRGAVEQLNRHESLWESERDFRIARAMVDADPFGFYFRGKGGVDAKAAYDFITKLAHDVGGPAGKPVRAKDVRTLFTEFHQYYQADFSSYYADSHFVRNGNVVKYGDKSGLSGLKESKPHGPLVTTDNGHRFEYGTEYEAKYQELKKLFDDAVEKEEERERTPLTEDTDGGPKDGGPKDGEQKDSADKESDKTDEPDTRPLTQRLPEYARDGQALGAVVATGHQGVQDVGTAITRLVHGMDRRANPPVIAGLDAFTGTLDGPGFESFLGPGRRSMVRVGEKWYEVHVKANLDVAAVTADDITKQPHPTIGDVNDQNQATHAQASNDTVAKTIGTSYFALIPPGAYVSVAPTVQLATAAQVHTSTVTGTEQRVIRSAGDVDKADVEVTYSITVTNQDGNLTGSTVDGQVSLLLSKDLGNLEPHEAKTPANPKAEWAQNIELLTPEAVLLDEQGLFDKVSKLLHPSVTKFGAPGRTALREFVSGGGIRGALGSALQGGPVVSNDLLSPHGSHRDAVQLQARPKDVELVGVVPGDSELRFNDSSVNGGSTAVSSKSGADLVVTVGGGAYLPGKVGGLVGVTGSLSSKVTETATAGTSVTTKNTVEAKGDIGLYKVKVDVDVVTSSGEKETVEAIAYVRMGLPEAKAQGLPVPDGTRPKLSDAGSTRHEPPYLAAAAAAGHVRAGSFSPAAKVQPQIETALRDRPGMAKFLPRWDKFQSDERKGSSRDIGERLANLRKLTAGFSPAALKSKMDSLLGPGVSVQLKRRGLFTDEYLNVTVKAKLSPGRHLGQATGRSVKGSVAASPSMSSATAVDRSWSLGVEGRMVVPTASPLTQVSVSPAVVPVQYSSANTWKNSGGPTVTTTFGTSGSPDAQVFEHDVEFEVEITSYTRNRPWVKRLTPGSPFRVTPKVSTVAKTGDKALPKISGKVDLWVNDGSALKRDPKDFLPGDPDVRDLTGTVPAIDDLLTTKPAAPPKFLHVEAFTGTEALRDAALHQLERAADGDGVLGLPGGEARKRVDRMFSPETFRSGLPKFLRQGARSGGFRYERRVADRVGGLGMDVSLSNPKVVAATDAGGSETTFAGGAKAGFEHSNKKSLEGNVQLGVTIRPDGSSAHGQGQIFTTAKWSPWTRTSGSSKELGASVDHVSRANAKGRTVLVQYDADVRLVAESRQESVVNGSTSRAGADVKLPGAVYVRMTEDQAREQGLLPKVDARTDPPGTVAPPALVGGHSSALGAAVVEDAPDLSQLIRDARANLGRTGDKLLPKSVLDDSMTNLQRTLDLAAPDSVTSLVDSALDGGAPLLLHDAGVLSTDTYQVLLKATITKTGFAGLVNDGGEVDHVVNATTTGKQNSGHGSSYGGQFRGAGRGLFRDNDPDVSGYEGLRLGISGSKSKTDQTVSSVATTTAIKSSQSGPAVRFRHEVKFELVVQRGGKTYPVTEQTTNVTVRAAADDHKIATDGGPAPKAFSAKTRELTAVDRTPEKLAEWQAHGVGELPPSSLTEGLRGSSAVRAGAVRALRLAGAGSGLTDPGTGANNTLVTSLTNEVLQAHLPGMLNGPLTAPDLHEGSLVKSGHGSVKVYARLVSPDLTGLSDSVKLERSDQNTATFTGEAKETLSGENQYQPGVGGVTDPKDASHSWTGADVRNPAPLSDPAASVAGGQRSTVAKPKGRSGLVGFDVEYRVVADLGGGRTAAVEVKVPASAVVRMSDADLEKLLGEALPDAITQAQDAVKDAATEWREAEEAVEQAQRGADDRWLDERDSVKTLTTDANRLSVPTNADPVGELRQALADVENDAKNAGRELREGNAEIIRLKDVAEQSRTLAAITEAGSPERQRLLDQAARARRDAQAIRDNQPALVQRRQDAQDRAARIANVLDEHRRDHADFTSLREDSLRQVREARAKADEARQKWWRAKEEVDWRLATHRWPTPKIESRFDPRFDPGQKTPAPKPPDSKVPVSRSTVDTTNKASTSNQRDVVEAPDAEPSTTISGWDTAADRPYDFDVAEIELRPVTDASGKVVAVSFLPAAEKTSSVEHDWLAHNSGEVSSLDEGVTSKTLDPVVAEARENGTRPDLGGHRFGEWAGKSPAPWDGDSFFVFAHGKPQSVKLTLLGGRTVRVDGDTFARIVARSAPFAQAGPKSSVTLIACSTGQADENGGVAHDFQRALAGLGGPATVHAPTKPTLFGRDTATLGQGLGSTGAFTAVTDGGHFRTFGGRPEDTALAGLVRDLAGTHLAEPPAGPIPLADPEATRALASTVERQLADTAARTGELRLVDVQDLVARHERPDVILSAVLTRLAERGVAVHSVVDARRDPDTGVWTRVPAARGLVTVTGKGTWHDGELSRSARLNPAWSAGPAREPVRPRADAAHYAETLAEHHLDGEPAPPVTVPADHVDRFMAEVTQHLAHLGFGDLRFDGLVHADHPRLTGEVVGEPGVTVDFAPSAVTTTVLTDHTGAARGLTFLEPAEAAKVRTWLRQTAGENLLVEADPDELRAFAAGRSADLRGRGPGEGGIRVLTPWANELAQGRTFLVTGHGEETRAKVLVPGPDGRPRAVYVDGETLARIVTAAPEFADADPDSVTLFQCGAARRLAPGGLAYDFHTALEATGGPAIVHAATDSVLANHRDDSPDDEPSAPLFGATDDAFTAVVRGGHWETLGRPHDADAVVAELTDALLKGWHYAPADPAPGPIPLSDRAATLALAAEVVNAVYDGRSPEELAEVAGRHQEPDLVTAVANAYFTATAAPELVMPEQGPPYESAERLAQDLHAAAADRTPPDGEAPLLGPDLFGLLRAPEPPDFLRGHDYRNLTAAQGVLLLNTLDLTADERPTAETTAPANLPHEASYALEQERPDHQLTAWAPGEVDPLPKVSETPLLLHAIWLGGPLRDAGTMQTFRANFGSAAQRFTGNVLSVLWTDVPRWQTDLARTTVPPAEGPDPLADVRDFVAWAQLHNVHLVNVDEVFTSEHPMLLQEFYNSETARRAGPGYAAASDILRMELMHRFGGLYTDGDNVVQGLDDLVTAAHSPQGYVTHRQGQKVANSAFAMPKGHPFARAYLDQQRENYGKTQRNLMPEGARTLPQAFFATPHGRVHRNSIMYRTGPEALSQTARRIGLANAHQLPEMASVLMNSDASWLKPPPAGEATRPQLGREDTLALTQRVVQTLVRGLYNRNGDLHLTAVEPAVRRHPDPDLVWHAALSFLAADPDLAPLVRTVTDRHTYTGDTHDVQLPPAARALLDIDADRVHHALGEVQHTATLRSPDAVLVSDVDNDVERGAHDLARSLAAQNGSPLPPIHVTGSGPDGRARAREAARELAAHLGRTLGDRDLLARVPVKIRAADGPAAGVTVSFRPEHGAAVEFTLGAPRVPEPPVVPGLDGKPYTDSPSSFDGYRGGESTVVTATLLDGSGELTKAADRPPTLVLARGALADGFTRQLRSHGTDLPAYAEPVALPDAVVDTYPAVSYLVAGDLAVTADDRRAIEELVRTAELDWWYRPDPPAGPVRFDDRAGTLALLGNAVSALRRPFRSGTPALDFTAAAESVHRHERPDLLWTAVLELAPRDARFVLDRRLVAGRWQHVELPESARERFTVTGKGVWRDGVVLRPVRLGAQPGPAADYSVEPVPLPLDDTVARWVAESTVERTADGLPAPRVEVSGPAEERARFIARVQAALAELTPAGVTPHAAADLVVAGRGDTAGVTISLPATPVPPTLPPAAKAAAVGLEEEFMLLQLHGVADTLLAKSGVGADVLLDLATEVAHGTGAGEAADAVEVLDRHGALDAALSAKGGRALLREQFRRLLGAADAETYARDLATALRAFAGEKVPLDVLREAVRGALEGWRGAPGTFEGRVARTRETLWVLRRFGVVNLAWLQRWRTAEHIRQYAERMKDQAKRQDELLTEVAEAEDAFVASVAEAGAGPRSGGDHGDGG